MARGLKYKLQREFLQTIYLTEDLYPHYIKNSLNKKTIQLQNGQKA